VRLDRPGLVGLLGRRLGLSAKVDAAHGPWAISPRWLLLAAVTTYVAAVAVLDLGGFLPLPGDGLIGLAQVLSGHLTLVVLLLVPFAFVQGALPVRLALMLLAIVAVARFGGEWWSPPAAAASGPTLEVMTWNVEIGSRPPAETAAFLQEHPAEVVALEELTTDTAAAIAADAELKLRYPAQALFGTSDVFGLGVLSVYPLSDITFERGPSRIEATVASPAGPVRLVVVHPLPAAIPRGPLGAPIGYDPSTRDAALGRVRTTVDTELRASAPVVVMGDINTAPTEPEFDRFTAGLTDAHATVGLGPGWTYRPNRLEQLGVGLIRIDVVLTGDGLRPVSEGTRCPTTGDHCAVVVTLARR
jgi:vancomycin resistance protein VanJ